MIGRVELASGVWAGHYEQGGRKYAQQMTLEFADGLIRGDGMDGIGPFTIDGEYRFDRADVRLGWIKTYEGAHSVLYLGTLEGGGIRGHWRLTYGNGGFEIRPSTTTTDVMPPKQRPRRSR